jgi:hypothetical protein
MLVFIMLFFSYQVCLVCKSCPHDQFVLNYGLMTKLYLARLSGSYSKSENPYLTGYVRALPDKSGVVSHQTSLVLLSDKSGAPGIKPFDRP